MSEPSVTAVMLLNGRHEMAQRAFAAFQHQAYPRKHLLIYNTGTELFRPHDQGQTSWMQWDIASGGPIGSMRNDANRMASSDIIVHWDSDDWSHQNRIEEQVAFLQSTGAEAVGYSEMLFWKTPTGHPSEVIDCRVCGNTYDRHMATVCPRCASWPDAKRGEAWLYSSPNPDYCLGTSLCYWQKTWEKRPFPAKHKAEDTEWLMRVKARAVTSLSPTVKAFEPRMVASIHGGNTCSEIKPRAQEWRRESQWDSWCREVMK